MKFTSFEVTCPRSLLVWDHWNLQWNLNKKIMPTMILLKVILLLCLADSEEEQINDNVSYSSYHHKRFDHFWTSFLECLSAIERTWCQQCIPCMLLLSIARFPWCKLYSTKNDQAVITLVLTWVVSLCFGTFWTHVWWAQSISWWHDHKKIITPSGKMRGRSRVIHPTDLF